MPAGQKYPGGFLSHYWCFVKKQDRKKENGIADDRQHLGYVDADCLLRAYQEQE